MAARTQGPGTADAETGVSDSFIDEVSEEVRRERLFGYMRRYGWIAGLLIVAVVAGAAWNEWSKARAEAQAQLLGDSLLSAMEAGDPAARAEALVLAQAQAEGTAVAVAAMLLAAEQEAAGATQAAIATLQGVAADAAAPQVYRDLAQFKSLILGVGIMDEAARRDGLMALAVPGRPFRMPALEQLAIATLADGDTEAALLAFRALIDDAEASEGLRERAQGMIVALGGETGVPVEG